MSQGERSCKMFGNCNHTDIKIENCNVDCDFYNPLDGIKPDSISKKPKEKIIVPDPNSPILELSDLPKFDKLHEFVVLKRHVFQMQSISPKKIILKFKRKLNKDDMLPDGCYTFKDQNKKLLKSSKVFAQFNRNTKEKAAKEKAAKEKTNKATTTKE